MIALLDWQDESSGGLVIPLVLIVLLNVFSKEMDIGQDPVHLDRLKIKTEHIPEQSTYQRAADLKIHHCSVYLLKVTHGPMPRKNILIRMIQIGSIVDTN